MKLHVLRDKSTPEGTPGMLTVLDTGWRCCDLELEWQNNKTGVSCVIADTYSCWPWYSQHLGRMVLRLEDKHGRMDCLVHNANFAGEASGDITQVHGCTAVGLAFGQIQKPNSQETQFGVTNSVATLTALMQEIGPGPHTIQYEWAPGCEPADLSDMNSASTS
jgi:hypothetical protein